MKKKKNDFQGYVYVSKKRKREGTRCCVCLPVQRWYAVDGLEAAARGHHIEAVSAVAGHVEVVFGVAVLHHHDEPCPAVGQVVARHALAALSRHERRRTHICVRTNPVQHMYYWNNSTSNKLHPYRRLTCKRTNSSVPEDIIKMYTF